MVSGKYDRGITTTNGHKSAGRSTVCTLNIVSPVYLRKIPISSCFQLQNSAESGVNKVQESRQYTGKQNPGYFHASKVEKIISNA